MDIIAFLFLLSFTIVAVSCIQETRDGFRYYIKLFLYGVYSTIIAIIMLPWILMSPGNVKNARHGSTFLRWYTKFLGIKWELRGADRLEKTGACVIVVNHQSILDVLGMFNIWHAMGDVAAVAKKTLLWVVPFGPVAWLAGTIFIDRNNSKESMRKLIEAGDRSRCHAMKLLIFPEGTRNKSALDSGLRPFKKGAFRIAIENQLPVLPIVYSPYYFIDEKTHFFGHGKVIVKVLEAISTKGLNHNDVDELIRRTQSIMQKEYFSLATEVFSSLPNDYTPNIAIRKKFLSSSNS
ncbi:hypothetical protein PV326_012009 [Microctonus aethiopoides]|uniref:1-acyl-sn-glycerol-3-phosphate acyltransferase n=1 Tax=Microctonus aethiopoides TaxID=144406 RepID=A0AA39FU73_9HYME|nr:hypothetical protein PV326_012009 [Microctonus aethiopoides]KAK0175920.1 hypothetical protein PV328_000109 [Microctonus aethiopoides]